MRLTVRHNPRADLKSADQGREPIAGSEQM